jgi:hypothetical protein
MRKFLGGNNTDTTAAVKAYLTAGNQFSLVDLILIGEPEDPSAKWLTDYEAPLLWNPWGTFLPAVIERDRKVTSQIGLSVASLQLRWKPLPTPFTTDVATANPIQLTRSGFYSNKRVRIWQCVMPNPGDANTYGACEWFGGWVGDSAVDRGWINFTINSFLSVVNQKAPPNVIEAQSTQAGFSAGTPVLADSETSVPTFTVAPGSDSTVINGICVQPTANKIYGSNKFINGYLVFLPGSTLAGWWSTVARSGDFNAGGGTHYNQFQVFAAFPFDPTPGDTFYVATQPPVNATDPGNQYQGEQFVPDPETAA